MQGDKPLFGVYVAKQDNTIMNCHDYNQVADYICNRTPGERR